MLLLKYIEDKQVLLEIRQTKLNQIVELQI